ncbi:MAG: hypothetical protein ACREJ0_13290, partial [Geminicoccaceae bacterium]
LLSLRRPPQAAPAAIWSALATSASAWRIEAMSISRPSRLTAPLPSARAHGLRPVDGPFGDFSDPDGYRFAARRAAALGCEGKWAIHPSQIALAHEVMTPPAAEVAKARRILAAMTQARAEGKGAVSLDGRLIDIASIRQAEALVAKAEQILTKS